MKDVIIGTAGHIDHGKTTLVKALTGIDADRLKEEKQRGITIDIGFAHMELDGYRVGFIDVPGHEKFVKNMLAGIGGIHLALLVVAADESVMPQTVEHFQICKLLGIPHGLIALTKKNNIEQELLELVEEEVRELVSGSFLDGARIVAVDSVSGQGIDALKEAILETIREEKSDLAPVEGHHFRLHVDRVFTIRGFGTVVTGTPYAGQIEVDRTVEIYPTAKQAKVRGAQIFNQKSSLARAGQRTALNLAGLEKQDLERGAMLGPPGVFSPSYMFDTQIQLLEDAPSPLKQRSPVRFHHGSAELLGRAYLLEGEQVEPGQTALVQLRLDTPTVACAKDRFILRRYSPMRTIGGGVILDPSPRKHPKKERQQVVPALRRLARLLEQQDGRELGAFLEYFVSRSGQEGLDLSQLSARTGLHAERIRTSLQELDGLILVPQEPLLAVSQSSLESLRQRILSFLDGFHNRQPLASGASSEEIKKRFFNRATATFFQFVMESLAQEKLLRIAAGKVGLVGREVQLDSAQQEVGAEILKAVSQSGWNPPSLAELCQQLPHPEKQVRDLYFFLLEQGELVRVTESVVLPAGRLEELKQKLQQRFTGGQAFSVADFKDLFGISRKYAIPYLEFLDRNRITQRVGDQRILKA